MMKKRLYRIFAGLLILILSVSMYPYEASAHTVPVRVGIYEMEGFHSHDSYGELGGYCIDYLNVVAGITDWTYEFVNVADFTEGCEKLANHEIDLLAPAMMTDVRKALYDYSELDFGTEYTVLVTTEDKENMYYEDYATFEGMKVAVLYDYPLTEYFISYMHRQEFTSELVYFDSIKESKDALANGEVDAIVASIMDMEDDYKLLARFSPQPFYFLTYKGNEAFLAELDSAMYRIQNTYPTLLDELLIEYYPIYELQYYTREEMAYVAGGKTLNVAYVSGRRPLSFTNDEGEFDGISRELFDRIAEKSGLHFNYIALPSGSITYDYLSSNNIQLITGVEYNSENMNSRGIVLSSPYIAARKVMVSRPEFEYEQGKEYKLGVISGSQTLSKVLNKKYPNLEIVGFESLEDCFLALYEGDIDMLVQNQYVVEAILTKPIYSEFSVVPVEGIDDELCFSTIVTLDGKAGLSKEESAILIGILNKSISQISDTELDDIIMRETLEHQYEIDVNDFLYKYRHTIMAGVCVLVLLQILAVVSMKEKEKREAILKEDAKRTALLQKRYQTIVDCSDDLIYEIGMDGESVIGSEKIKQKFGWELQTHIEELNFKNVMEILHIHADDEALFRESQITNGDGGFDECTVRIRKADGSYIWCRVSRTVFTDGDGNFVSILGKIVDVDEEVKEKKKLEHRSRTDLLTGLLNKNTFEREVREYVEKNSTQDACFIFIDMDHFKDINDKFGHRVGDQVIRETAKKIQLLFANFDLVGRFGGDEFCVFMKEIPRDTLIDRLKFAVKKLEQDYAFEGGAVKLSASIGAAYCKKSDVGYKELLDVADAAAYRAKDNGRNCYIIEDIEL